MEDKLTYVICKLMAILYQPQCVQFSVYMIYYIPQKTMACDYISMLQSQKNNIWRDDTVHESLPECNAQQVQINLE